MVQYPGRWGNAVLKRHIQKILFKYLGYTSTGERIATDPFPEQQKIKALILLAFTLLKLFSLNFFSSWLGYFFPHVLPIQALNGE